MSLQCKKGNCSFFLFSFILLIFADSYLNPVFLLPLMEAYKAHSFLTVTALLIFAVSIGFLVSQFQGGLTGAVVTVDGAACSANTECNDYLACTVDSCKNAGLTNSFCSYAPIESCVSADGCCPAGCTTVTDSDCN